MATPSPIDWNAVIADPRFQALPPQEAVVPHGNDDLLGRPSTSCCRLRGLLPDLYRPKSGASHFGLLFALLQFVVAWSVGDPITRGSPTATSIAWPARTHYAAPDSRARTN